MTILSYLNFWAIGEGFAIASVVGFILNQAIGRIFTGASVYNPLDPVLLSNKRFLLAGLAAGTVAVIPGAFAAALTADEHQMINALAVGFGGVVLNVLAYKMLPQPRAYKIWGILLLLPASLLGWGIANLI
jgi:hypothetical protein